MTGSLCRGAIALSKPSLALGRGRSWDRHVASGRVGAVTFLESCRHCSQWVARRAGWSKPGVGIATPEGAQRIRRLWRPDQDVTTRARRDEAFREGERENAELRRGNEILKTVSAFFAAELDRPAE